MSPSLRTSCAASRRRRSSASSPRSASTLGIHATVARLDTPAGPVRDFIVSAPDAAAPLAEADVARLAAAVGFDGAVVRPATTPRLFHVLVSGHNRP